MKAGRLMETAMNVHALRGKLLWSGQHVAGDVHILIGKATNNYGKAGEDYLTTVGLRVYVDVEFGDVVGR